LHGALTLIDLITLSQPSPLKGEGLYPLSLRKNHIKLYGSYAKGNPRQHSDIDIAVISPSFKGKRIIDIQSDLAEASSKYLAIVEPVGYSTDDYESAKMGSLLGEIKKSGKILYSKAK